MKFKAEKEKKKPPLVFLVSYFDTNPERAGIFDCEALTKNAWVSILESQMFGFKVHFPLFTWESFGLSTLFCVLPEKRSC